jgi:hypothetical protein
MNPEGSAKLNHIVPTKLEPENQNLLSDVRAEIQEKNPESVKEITKVTTMATIKKRSEKQIAWSKELGRNSQTFTKAK